MGMHQLHGALQRAMVSRSSLLMPFSRPSHLLLIMARQQTAEMRAGARTIKTPTGSARMAAGMTMVMGRRRTLLSSIRASMLPSPKPGVAHQDPNRPHTMDHQLADSTGTMATIPTITDSAVRLAPSTKARLGGHRAKCHLPAPTTAATATATADTEKLLDHAPTATTVDIRVVQCSGRTRELLRIRGAKPSNGSSSFMAGPGIGATSEFHEQGRRVTRPWVSGHQLGASCENGQGVVVWLLLVTVC